MTLINPLFLARYGLEAQALSFTLPQAYVRVTRIEQVWRPKLFSGFMNQGGDGLPHLQQYKGVIWKRTRQSHRRRQDPEHRATKQADLDLLEMAAAVGDIDLFYLDESGCCQWSSVSYSYYFRGEQKRQEQTQKRGRRLSILGLWQPLVTFIYGLVFGSMKSENYIAMMDVQAQTAQQTGRMRVVVQDNGSIHKSKVTQQKWTAWEAQGLYMFFLPAYCSEMNPIEGEWQHLKRDELRGHMFESEAELAYHVVEGLENRGEIHGHTTQYVNVKTT